jgi:NAD(P)-dependent dehydrogenase (short-subunit alcohol dehydrogenase family)
MKGSVVLVAGGTGSLGSELSLTLARKECTVYATSRGSRRQIVQSDPLWNDIRVIRADMTIEADVRDLFDRIIRESSRIDVVINAVGGYLPEKLIADVSLEEWDLMMESNLKTTFLLTREAIRRMNGQPYGRIINISAMTGLRPVPGRIPYSISKHAVALLTELAAQELAASPITINAIAPGVIATASSTHDVSDERARHWASPSSIADLVTFLCSPSASVISGTTIRLPGGS